MTNSHEPDQHPDLFALVKGELSNITTIEAGDHLAACSSCREELVDVLVGHAVMSRAARTLRSAPAPTVPSAAPELHDLPHLVMPRRRPSGRLLLAAAAAVIGGTVAGALALDGDDAPSKQTPVATPERLVALDSVEGSAVGEVRMVQDDEGTLMTISAPDLPGTDSQHFYQAWLLDPATNKMLTLGLVSGESTTFRITDDLLAQYAAVDVSLEEDDGDPEHSVTSVLRGSYEPTV